MPVGRTAYQPAGACVGEDAHRFAELSSIGGRPCQDEPTFGEHVRIRRGASEVVPEGTNPTVVPERPVTVHPGRVLVRRSGQRGEGVELEEGGPPVADAVVAETEQLAGRRRRRHRIDDGTQHAQGISVALALEGGEGSTHPLGHSGT